MYALEEPIAALATPWGTSALAVIRVSGDGCVDKIAALSSRPAALREAAGGSLHHAQLLESPGGGRLDEVVLAVYRAPASYTGEESLEIFCHGSPPGIQAILARLAAAGIRAALPGEFTWRAFMHGKMDLTRAEAVHELVTARTDQARALALNRLGGALERRIESAKQTLLDLVSTVELQLDYPEEDAPDAVLDEEAMAGLRRELAGLAGTAAGGRLYQEGARVALAGATNAGKSALFNLLLRTDRAIVSELHGTTRDYLEAWIALDGLPLLLFDTAGLRRAADPVEAEGIRRSREVIEAADLVLYLVDATAGLTPADQDTLAELGRRALLVWNKIDLPGRRTEPRGAAAVSAATGLGLGGLEIEIVRRLRGQTAYSGQEVVITSRRQKELLDKALAALDRTEQAGREELPLDLLAVELREALTALGEITGEVTSEDVLAAMFGRFCVGK